jgi:hypothetical protein
MRRLTYRLLAIAFLISLIGAATVKYLPSEADGAGNLIVTIHPGRADSPGGDSILADVDPERGGIVTFVGYINVEQWLEIDAQYAVVDLNAEIEGWPVTEIPMLVVNKMQTRIPFSLSIMIPPRSPTSGLDYTKALTISGTWSYVPETNSGQITPVTFFIYIKQYYEYSVRCKQPYIQTSPGGEFDIELEITNTGNGDDEVTVDIDRRSMMESNGWAFVFEVTKFEISHGKKVVVPIHIATPKKWEGWRNNIVVLTFTVASEQAAQTGAVVEAAVYSIYIRQRGVSVPGLEIPVILLGMIMVLALTIVRRRK